MKERKRSMKALIASLGACALFLAGSGSPGNASASFTNAVGIKTAPQGSQWKQEAEADLRENVANLMLANQRTSNFRDINTRKKRSNHRSSFQTNRQNNPRFFQRNRRPSFSTPNLRSYSNRERLSNQRSAVRTNSLNKRVNSYKRPRSRNFEFITPGK